MLNSTQAVQGADAVFSLRTIVSLPQRKALGKALRGSEGEHFLENLLELVDTFKTMPKTYEQDGKGSDAVAYMHFFSSGNDYYITEKDMYEEQNQAFGLVNAGFGFELGYVSLVELAANNVEIDLYWTPTTIGAIKSGL